MANDYLLQEDGASKITLEDGTGFLILESSPDVGGTARRRHLLTMKVGFSILLAMGSVLFL
jgi:hypothetical protein